MKRFICAVLCVITLITLAPLSPLALSPPPVPVISYTEAQFMMTDTEALAAADKIMSAKGWDSFPEKRAATVREALKLLIAAGPANVPDCIMQRLEIVAEFDGSFYGVWKGGVWTIPVRETDTVEHLLYIIVSSIHANGNSGTFFNSANKVPWDEPGFEHNDFGGILLQGLFHYFSHRAMNFPLAVHLPAVTNTLFKTITFTESDRYGSAGEEAHARPFMAICGVSRLETAFYGQYTDYKALDSWFKQISGVSIAEFAEVAGYVYKHNNSYIPPKFIKDPSEGVSALIKYYDILFTALDGRFEEVKNAPAGSLPLSYHLLQDLALFEEALPEPRDEELAKLNAERLEDFKERFYSWVYEQGAPSSWAAGEVSFANELGLVPDELNNFYTSGITRVEFCRLAINTVEAITGQPVSELLRRKNIALSSVGFSDCDELYVLQAYALGIVTGYDGLFNPLKLITRQEAAAMIQRTAAAVGIEASNPRPPDFSDNNRIAAWADDAVAFAVSTFEKESGKALMGGVGSNRFSPLGTLTREQAIIIFKRLYCCA